MKTAFADHQSHALSHSYARPEIVLADRPVLRRTAILYFPLVTTFFALLIAVPFLFTYLSIEPFIAIIMGGAIILLALFTIFLNAKEHIRLRSTRYTVTAEYIEVAGGFYPSEAALIQNQFSERIPLAYVRDVRVTVTPAQRWAGVGTVTVQGINRASIKLEDVADPDRKRDLIWNLVTNYLRPRTRADSHRAEA